MEGAKGSERVERERESGRERKDRETCSLSKERERGKRDLLYKQRVQHKRKKNRKKDGGKRNKFILGHTLSCEKCGWGEMGLFVDADSGGDMVLF